MAISSDWNIDFTLKVISHVDGVLTWDANATTGPAAADYVRGDTSTAVGKVLSRTTDTGLTGATGELTLTSVVGQYENNEPLTVLDRLGFARVVNAGFEVGDTLFGQDSGASMPIYALEYEATGGTGAIYGVTTSGPFNDGEWLLVNAAAGTSGATAEGVEVDNANLFTSALVDEATNGTITPPTTSVLVNFDTGTTGFIRFANVVNKADGGETATGAIEQVYGAVTEGTIRLVDSSSVAAGASGWTADTPIFQSDMLFFDNVQSGQSFKLNDLIVGAGSAAEGVVIEVDAVNGYLTLLNQTGTFSDDENINVDGTYIADVTTTGDFGNFTQIRGTTRAEEITTQLDSQGGVYSNSLNAVRDANAFYTYLQDTFDELGALDDTIPMTAQVKLQQYTLVNSWVIPDLSFRFLESGSIQDLALDNIWTTFQTLGSVNGIGDEAFFATTPQPQFYIEQNGAVIDTFWIAGQIDVLVKVKTSTRPDITTTATAGVNIDNGTVTIFARRFGDTYDHFETTTIAGVAPIPLATSNDLDNTTGTHELKYDNESSGPFTVGEEIVDSTDATKRGVITALEDSGPSGSIDYILTGTTNFANNDPIVGQTSGAGADVDGAANDLVSGYTTDIVIATAQLQFDYDNKIDGTAWIEGELLSLDSTGASGATAILMFDSNPFGGAGATGTFVLGNFQGTTGDVVPGVILTGNASGVTALVGETPTTNDVIVVNEVLKDIGDGVGLTGYNAVVFMDRTGANSRTLADMYEWVKYRTRRQEIAGEPAYSLLGGADSGLDPWIIAKQGRIYITLNTGYALVKVSPVGSFAGGTFFGARGVFIQDMVNADIRNFQLIDARGTVRTPPNLQSLTVQGLVSGDRVAVFRRTSTTPGTPILFDEFSADGTQSSGAGAVVVADGEGVRAPSPNLPSDLPASGVLRIFNDITGLYDSYAYASFSVLTFTLTGTLSQDYADGTSPTGDVYIPLIQEEATGTSVAVNIIHSVIDLLLCSRDSQLNVIDSASEATEVLDFSLHCSMMFLQGLYIFLECLSDCG